MKVYISGPITGTDDYMKRFENAENYLIDKGYSVVNPAMVNSMLPTDTTYKEYMLMSLAMLQTVDTVYMLKGWEESKGASLECQYALTMGYKIMYEE